MRDGRPDKERKRRGGADGRSGHGSTSAADPCRDRADPRRFERDGGGDSGEAAAIEYRRERGIERWRPRQGTCLDHNGNGEGNGIDNYRKGEGYGTYRRRDE